MAYRPKRDPTRTTTIQHISSKNRRKPGSQIVPTLGSIQHSSLQEDVYVMRSYHLTGQERNHIKDTTQSHT